MSRHIVLESTPTATNGQLVTAVTARPVNSSQHGVSAAGQLVIRFWALTSWPCDELTGSRFVTLAAMTAVCEIFNLLHFQSTAQRGGMARKTFRIGTVRYHWPMSAHASQAFSIASCTDSEDLPMAQVAQW